MLRGISNVPVLLGGESLAKQDYCLDFADYTLTITNTSTRSVGRQFTVSGAAKVRGLRVKFNASATLGIRLYNADTDTLMASKDSLSYTSGNDSEFEFDADEDVTSGVNYTIAVYSTDLSMDEVLLDSDTAAQTNGDMVTLTANKCFVYGAADTDEEPETQWANRAIAIEPMVFA